MPKEKETMNDSSDLKYYYFSTLLGVYIFDKDLRKIEFQEIKFDPNKYEDLIKQKITQLKKKYNLVKPDLEKIRQILQILKNQDFEKLRKDTIELMKIKTSKTWSNDDLIILTISTIDEITRALNIVFGRLREYNSLNIPEIEKVHDLEKYIELSTMDKNAILKRINEKVSMGASLSKEDEKQIQDLAKMAMNMINELENKKKYLEMTMSRTYPTFSKVAEVNVGARLIRKAGSGLELAMMPSGGVQVLGAEKALFKHLTYGSDVPKYGIIFNHPRIQEAEQKGKEARRLSAEISKAIRIDIFSKKEQDN